MNKYKINKEKINNYKYLIILERFVNIIIQITS